MIPQLAPRRRLLARLALAALACAAPHLATAQTSDGPQLPTCGRPQGTLTSPFVGLIVNGACTGLSEQIFRTSETAPTWGLRTSAQIAGGGTIDLQASYDGDPFITFSLTTTSLIAGPVTFGFTFGTPILPGSYNFASATVSASVTPGQSQTATVANSSLFPTYLSGYGTLGAAVITNLGVNTGTGPCTATTVAVSCAIPTVAASFAPTSFDNLEAMITYDQTGLGGVAAWTGRVDLLSVQTTVPEPAAATLVAVGLVATGLVGRRAARRRAR